MFMIILLCTFFVFPAVTPLSDYYIIAGVVYQAPDLGSVIGSRVVSCSVLLCIKEYVAQWFINFYLFLNTVKQ